GGGVVGLAGTAERRVRREVDNPAVLALAHMRRRGTDRAVVPLEMHSDHVVPFLFGHVENHAVAQDAGDVDQDIELAEFLDRLVDEALAAFDGGDIHVIGNGVAARGLDFLDHVVGGRLSLLLARDRDPKIVDYYCASLRGECPRDAAADAATAAGDSGYFSVELAHRSILPCGMMPESKRAQRFGSCDRALIPQTLANGTDATPPGATSQASRLAVRFVLVVRIGKNEFSNVTRRRDTANLAVGL